MTEPKDTTDYKGYTIEQVENPYGGSTFYTYLGSYDAWLDGDTWRDNAHHADSLQDAKEWVDEKILEKNP